MTTRDKRVAALRKAIEELQPIDLTESECVDFAQTFMLKAGVTNERDLRTKLSDMVYYEPMPG